MIEEAHIFSEAEALSALAGRPRARSVVKLSGGKNNRVYAVEDEAGGRCVLKCYFSHPLDPRDRLQAEWRFLTYVWSKGVRMTPQPLAVNPKQKSALYSFVDGRKLHADEPKDLHVEAALDFLTAVNAPPRDLTLFLPASEACFTLQEHLDTIDTRVRRLEVLRSDAPLYDEASAFVQNELLPGWTAVRDKLINATSLAQRTATIAEQSRCISPSDFGFHNALFTGERATFLDFEYAGQDDVAKLVNDFFCCPETPAPIASYESFTQSLITALGGAAQDVWRCCALLDAYRIKWTCIILNNFLPTGAARRAFSTGAQDPAVYGSQLVKARSMLETASR